MREKLFAIIPQYIHAGGSWGIEMDKLIDNILTLISEKVEKLENPYKPQMLVSEHCLGATLGFEECCQKILSLLKEQA